MVGLQALPEVAWAVEQTLNHWLQLELQPTARLYDAIGDAHRFFDDWVRAIERGDMRDHDAQALIATVEALREPAETGAPVATAPAPDAPVPGAPGGEAGEDADFVDTQLETDLSDLTHLDDALEALDFAETQLDGLEPLDDAELPTLAALEPPIRPGEPQRTAADAVDETAFTLTDLGAFESSLLGEADAAIADPVDDDPTDADLAFDLESIELDEPAIDLYDDAPVPSDGEEPEPAFAPPASAAPPDRAPAVAPSVNADESLLIAETQDQAQTALTAAFDFGDFDELDTLDEPVVAPALHDAATWVGEGRDLGAETDDTAPGVAAPEPAPEAAASTADEAPIAPAGDESARPGADENVQTPLEEALEALADLERGTTETALATTAPVDQPDTLALEMESAVERPALDEAADGAADDAVAESGDTDLTHIGDIEISTPLLELYLAEAREHIARLHDEFDHLRYHPGAPPSELSVRAAHTLAGISGTARIMPIHHLGKAFEHAVDRLHKRATAPSVDELDLIDAAIDRIESMLAEVGSAAMPREVPALEQQLDVLGIEIDDPGLPAIALAPATPIAPPPAAAETMAAEIPDSEPSPQVHDDLDEQLLPIFVEEATDLLTQLHDRLRHWQDDLDNPDHNKATARLLHTLKGSARMTGAMTLGELVHQLESRLELGTKSAQPTPVLVDELVGGLDQVQQIVDRIAAGESPVPATATGEAAGADAAVTIEADGGVPEIGGAMLRVKADAVDRLVNEAGEIGIARTRIEGELRTLRRSLLDLTENVIRLRNQLREVEIQADVQMQSRQARADHEHTEFDPLEMDRYTRLQELTRLMAESVGDVTTVQQNLLRNLDGAELALHGQARMSRDLQQALMQVRMVPFDSLADRLYRVVRQSAKDLGKRVNLDIRGGRIEIDRSVLERMTAALEHLLRNAVAHGVESPAVRRAAGKDEIGQITLAVSHEANEIVITLADDGKGLDYDAIANRARERGLLGADEATDTRRLTNLIFVPGFSTADSLSAVSGRGVGMDVVKSETAAVGGRIDVASSPENGTSFKVYLPLTLAVTQAVLVRASGRSYAIPSNMVAQVLELKADAMQALMRDGGTDWGGEHFAYRYLPHLLGETEARAELSRFNWTLLLRAGAQTLALHVDHLRGNQEIVVKNAGPQLVRIIGISGATVLGDGEIVLILNPVALASRSLGEHGAGTVGAGSSP
nr:Hpt domain-containing protein [Zoogloeaceae bacterium]